MTNHNEIFLNTNHSPCPVNTCLCVLFYLLISCCAVYYLLTMGILINKAYFSENEVIVYMYICIQVVTTYLLAVTYSSRYRIMHPVIMVTTTHCITRCNCRHLFMSFYDIIHLHTRCYFIIQNLIFVLMHVLLC